MFEDTVNEALPEFQKELGLRVNHSNLCSEILEYSDSKEYACCTLASIICRCCISIRTERCCCTSRGVISCCCCC